MTYAAPVRDIRFSLEEIAGLSALREQGMFLDASADLVEQILVEAGKRLKRLAFLVYTVRKPSGK